MQSNDFKAANLAVNVRLNSTALTFTLNDFKLI